MRPASLPVSPPPPPRWPAVIHHGLLAALAWVLADLLGLPAVAGVPFLPLLPVALVAGCLLAVTRLGPVVSWAAGLLVLLTLVIAFTPLLRPGVRAVIATDPVPPSGADAIVVLSASVSRDSLLSPGGAERLLHGVELLRSGAAPVVVTSRVRYRGRAGTVTSDADQARLLRLAPDSVRWLVVDSVATTRDEAVQVAALAGREGLRHVIVVTSPMHTRRACAAFRHAGLAVTCVAAPSRAVAVHSLASASDRVAAFGPWLYETVGWWWYGWRGWR